MNKLSFLSLLGFLLTLVGLAPAAAQTIRRVNNTGITGTNIYADLPAAYAAAAAGDIIQVEPSGTAYSGIAVNKNVTIVGPGYFLDPSQNAGLQANPLPATVSTIEVQAGGANAYIAGLTISGTFYIEASNVTVQRCNIGTLYVNGSNQIGTPQTLTNVIIRQNYINQVYAYYSMDNILFTNNIFVSSINIPASYNGGFYNNVLLASATLNNLFVTNNYFTASPGGAGNTFNNNISAQAFTTAYPNVNGNLANVPQSSVFVLAPGATAFDAWYQLKAGTNPARGTGQGGIDVGAFGGTTPYKLGGLPNIPAIYQEALTISGNSLNVTLSTRANN
ncbi:hypothetical protein GCM10023172_29210 [Hymenobacter ginsengisoli]|uniref:Right handed beta helix domain-containing protein n=1 Tax=Hymenobacter ginsengisoli TaxID=1051626 RepID=A0ABP8QID2_9BACT|nr:MULTISPECIES: hypothetical protein [unclassified Hymenobacter]MBO2029823.1 hypothetical protein [Hymenobacter sp. BT559]